MPGGTAKSSGAAVVALAAICSRRSISLTFSVKLSRRERSGALISVAQAGDLAVDRVEDALVALAARDALLGRAAAAEHALEHDLRVQLHRQRRRRRRPGDRVRVHAAVALAAVARARAGILDRHLHRRQQRLAADLLRDDLVDRLAGANVGAGGLLRLVGAQERRGDPVVGARFARRRLRGRGMQAGQDREVLSRYGSSGFQMNGSSAGSAPSFSGTQ